MYDKANSAVQVVIYIIKN